MPYDFTIPATPSSDGDTMALRLRALSESVGSGDFSNDVQITVNYQRFIVNTIFQTAFSSLFLPTGVKWLDGLLEKEGFRLYFKANMWRMLEQGEYFAYVGVRKNRTIFIDRIPNEWVKACVVDERTGELALLIYIVPVISPKSKEKLSYMRVTWTPTIKKVEINYKDPHKEELYITLKMEPNIYGFVPVVPFKLGGYARGEPVWKPVEDQIKQISDIINDIRYLNKWNADPIKYIKTNADIKRLSEFIQIGPEDDIGVVQWNIGDSLFSELEVATAAMCDITGIPITSVLQVGKHATGEAIDKRKDILYKISAGMREDVGNKIELMMKMICAFISLGLVSMDFNDKDIQALMTKYTVFEDSTEEEIEEANTLWAMRIEGGFEPTDLSAYIVPKIIFPPIDSQIDGLQLVNFTNALILLIQNNLIKLETAQRVLFDNFPHIAIANDLSFVDNEERQLESLGSSLPEYNSMPTES